MKSHLVLIIYYVFFLYFNGSSDVILKERRTFSFIDYSTGDVTNDSILILIETFNRKGYVLSEQYTKDSVTYYYSYNDKNQIKEIVKYDKNNELVKRIEAPISNDGKLIPLKRYEPPELSCKNEYVRCLYNIEGYISSRIVVDESSGIIISKKSYVYKYW